MPTHIPTFKPVCQGQARRQTKLQIACQKAFRVLKQPITGIKRGCSPIESGVSSYEINIAFKTDPLGYSSQTSYNSIDQPTQSTNALQQTSRLSYDAAGRITAVINPAGVTIEAYTYDNQGRLTSQSDALNQTTSTQYDSSNRPNRVTDRKGQVTSISYNERSQVASITKPDRTISFAYDTLGRTTEVRDAASVVTTQYDAADRITQTDTTTSAGSHKLQYSYDSLDRITSRTLSGTGINGSGINTPEVTNYTWDLGGKLLSHSTTVGGQLHATSYSYDNAARLASRKVQAGNAADPNTTYVTQAYGYDAADRLSQIKYIKAQGTAGEQLIEQIDYSYDAKGQRTSKTTLNNNGTGTSETPMSATFDSANRMTGISLNIQGTTKTYALSYDSNGNLTQKQNSADAADKTTYAWDTSNRLTQLTQTGATAASSINASFSYDAFGRRIQSTIAKGGQAANTVQYLYEGQQALGEIRNGQLTNRILTGLSLDETIARIAINTNGTKDAANSRIFMTDALNSVIAQLADDNNASIQNNYGYSPYGESQTVGPDGTNNSIQYTSRENDGTGLMFYRARYYDPVLKIFISEDPIGLQAGMNFRGYVEGNPLSFTDPEGLQINDPTVDPVMDRPCATQCTDISQCLECCHAQARKSSLSGVPPSATGQLFLNCRATCTAQLEAKEPSPPPLWCKVLPSLCKSPKLPPRK